MFCSVCFFVAELKCEIYNSTYFTYILDVDASLYRHNNVDTLIFSSPEPRAQDELL